MRARKARSAATAPIEKLAKQPPSGSTQLISREGPLAGNGGVTRGAKAADPSAALWRGYIASKMGRWTEARQAFPQGYAALAQFSPDWKARFTRADLRRARSAP